MESGGGTTGSLEPYPIGIECEAWPLWCFDHGKFWGLAESDPCLMCEANLTLPTDAQARKGFPVATGVLDYFPDALAAVAAVSKAGNDQHNPGEPLHWARGKSTDQADCLIRHFLGRGTLDEDNLRHSAKMAWRALALLQLELEADGAPMARGAR